MKVEIRLIKIINTDVPIFSTCGIAATIRVKSERVNRTKVSLQTCKFFFEYQVEKS